MKWFRLYDDLLDDPKVQQLSPALFKHWVNLLCLASKHSPRGRLPGLSEIAFRIRLPRHKAVAVLEELRAMGLIEMDGETFAPHNWDGRQRVSDNVADRVRRHRESASRGVSVTLQPTLHVTDSSLLTDTDTDTDINAAHAAAEPPPAPPSGPSVGRSPPAAISQPYRLFQALCEELGADEATVTKREKQKQLGIAKQLVAEGVTEEELRRHVRYLQSQSWRTGLIDLTTARGELGKWRLHGSPDREPTPLRPPTPRVATL